uniref:Phytocyanin domain-containing protein n=1 Tax=Oryza meridionalis TaxID=40149 RepID=A0A0E0D5B4_9ORYZ
MASSLLAAVAVVMAAEAATVFVGAASGASYTVGEPGGAWDTQTNLTAWASTVDLRRGDQLVFRYDASAYDVVEVTRAGYLSCSAASPVSAALRTGNDVVRLDGAAGWRYFICGVQGRCAAGMKLQVRVTDAGAGCNNTLPSLAPAPPGAPSPGITICSGGPPTVIMTPGVISYGAAPGSSANLSSSLLVAMVSLLLGLIVFV